MLTFVFAKHVVRKYCVLYIINVIFDTAFETMQSLRKLYILSKCFKKLVF